MGRRSLLPAFFAVFVGGCAAPDPPAAPPPRAAATAPAAPAPVAAPLEAARATPPVIEARPAPFRSSEPVGLLIRGGDVIDGAGGARRRADVVVAGRTIVFVGEVDPSVEAAHVIDATGKVVTPGFIDMHAHVDAPYAGRASLAMGVTTICIGQDGTSPTAEPLAAFMARTSRKRLGVNVAPFVGHGTVRQLAGVGLATAPRPEAVARMAALVEDAMVAGAFGLSTGLEYAPGRMATPAELVAVARPVGAHDGLVASHLRSEDDDAIDAALGELVAQGEGARARVHVAHVKVVYGRGEARAEALLARIDEARRRGVAITADLYPYEASYTGIGIVFPDWARAPHDYREVVASRGDELRAFLRARVTRRNGPEATLFGASPFQGETLAQVAARKHQPFEDVLVGLGPTGGSAAYFVMDAALQRRLARDPHVMIGSDGGDASRHPRGHGTFARVVRELVVEGRLFSLEEAVRKMTGLPAETLRLDRRGLVREGFAADLLVFDPAAVRDVATYDEPQRLALGFDVVVVNGERARDAGAFTNALAGELLRRTN